MKKTNRQNKTGQVVNWPTSFYVVDNVVDPTDGTTPLPSNIPSLWNQNPHFILITLRVRLNNAIQANQVVSLGTIKGEKGRPKLVYANVPVSQETIEAARAAGVTLNQNIPHVVNVMSVTPSTEEVSEVVEHVSHTVSTTVPAV